MARFKDYYSLTKPRVLYGNVLTGAAGFLLASGRHINIPLLIALSIGMTLIIASACVLNNYLDQDIDSKMARTKSRAIVAGRVKGKDAVILSILLGILGAVVLVLYTNVFVVWIGAIGYVDYVVLYGMLSKRQSIHGTLVGSISGAMPILAGYVAVSGRIDMGAFLVFLILFFWQLPEFYSIAIYRLKEYKAAGVPVISVVKGVKQTTLQIFLYTMAFVVATILLVLLGHAGYTYLVVMGLVDIYWLWLGAKGFKAKDHNAWARKMFHFSLIVLLVLCAVFGLNAWLP